MFIASDEINFLYVDYPLSVQQVPESLKQYILKCNEANTYKEKENILPYFCYSIDIKNAISKEEWDKLYTFGIIHNPYDRIIDMYEFLTEDTSDRVAWIKGIKDRKEAVREQHRLKSRGFIQWLVDDKSYDYLHTSPFCGYRFTPQINWLSEVKDIYSFHHTTPLMNKLFELAGVTMPSFKGLKSSAELKYRRDRYFKGNQKAIDLIEDLFKEDLNIIEEKGSFNRKG